MEAAPGETTSLYLSHPDIAAKLLAQLEADVARGRSTDGAAVQNDTKEIVLCKTTK